MGFIITYYDNEGERYDILACKECVTHTAEDCLHCSSLNYVIQKLGLHEDIGEPNELIKPVRCRDCKSYHPYFDDSTCTMKSSGGCTKCGGTRAETYFCAWGERRTESEVKTDGE